MKKFISLLLIAGAMLSGAGWADGARTLLLADSEPLLEGARDHFSEIVDAIPTDIERDYLSQAFITGEGSRIPFGDLFHRRSMRGVAGVRQLQEEYAPETLSMLWIEKEEVREYKAYGVKKRNLRLRLRVIDPVSGRTVVDRSVNYKPKFKSEPKEEEREEARREMLAEAVSEFDLKRVGRELDRHMDTLQAMANKVRVVVQGVDQKEYFEWRDGLLSMVESAGISGELRDQYDEARDTLTIRGEALKGVPDFFRSLYHSTLDSELLDNFDISRAGPVIELKELPAESKRLVVGGLSADRYHNRLGIYRSALEAVEGVRKLEHQFVSNGDDSRLIFTFLSKEELPVVEEQLWSTVQKMGELPNRELVSISEHAIHYRVGEAMGDVSQVVVVVNNIAPSDYRAVGAELDRIIKGLEATGLEKGYSREDYQLRYSFQSKDRAVDLDSTIWSQIAAVSGLENIVQDSGVGNRLGYFFNQDRPEKQQIVVTVRNVAPEDYSKAGRMLISTVKQIEGVEKFSYDYTESEQTINMTFLYQGENAYAIDGVIWERVKGNQDLSGLTTGVIDEGTLEYFFSGDATKGSDQVIVVMKGVSGQDYKHVSTTFAKILRAAKNVSEVRYGYTVKDRTIKFQIKYSGEGLFALEDAIQLGLVKDALLKSVERGEDTKGRLVYRYTKGSDESEEFEVGIGESSGSTSSSLIGKLDKSVVYILAEDQEGVSEGTGFFVSKNGHILTNAHVVDGSSQLFVKTFSGDRYRAEVIDANARLDIALIRLATEKKGFPAVRIGNSDKVNKGDSILMIGNPLGVQYEHTVLKGIISGFNRQEGAMQLSIPSYPGSSGSPVFDRKGKVVGVMMARAMAEKAKIVEVEKKAVMLTTHEAVENIGLAVPVNYVRPMLGMVK